MSSGNPRSVSELRSEAEARLNSKASPAAAPLSAAEANRLVHELQVRQIELEIQNEEIGRSRQELETGLARYTDLYDFAPVGYVTLDRAGQITQSNLAAAGLLGTERARLQGQRLAAFVAAADLAHFNACMAGLFIGEPAQSCEVTLEAAGQPLRSVRIVATRAESGAECRLVIEDITVSRQAVTEERGGAAKFARLIDSVDGILWEADAATFQFTYVSSRAERLLGYPVARWTGEPAFWADHIHPEDRDQAVHFCATCTANKQDHDFEYRMLAADGSTVWLRDIVTVEADRDRPIKLSGVMVDITKRKATEAALRRSTLLLEASQATAKVGGWELDLGTGQLFWTAETYRIHDTSPEEFNPTVEAGVGFYLPESRRIIADALQAAMARGEGYDLVLETLTTKGRRIDVRTTCEVTLHEGRPAKLTGIFQDITARTTAEAAQARLAAIVASSDDAIISKDLDGIITTWNHGAEKLFGYAAAEIIGQSVTRLLPPEKRAEGLEILAQIIAGKPMIRYETVRLAKDGRPIEVWTTISPIHDSTGRIIGSAKIVRDITVRKRAESSLRLLEASVAQLNDAVIITEADVLADPGPRIVFVNEATERLTGYTRAELIGQSPRRLQGPKTDRAELDRIATALRQGKPAYVELINYTKAGDEYWIELNITPVLSAAGVTTHFVAIQRDVTARKAAEEQLAAARRELDNVKVAMDEHALVAITDAQGKINFVNDKFCATAQYARAELLGQDHRIINSGYHPKEFIRELWTTIGRGRVWKGELKNRAKDGSFYWVDTTIVPFLTPGGKPYQYVAIRTDITPRKQAESEVRLLNAELEQRVRERTAELEAANRELEAFSYSVSHDLRAPLRHLTGFAELLQKNDRAKLDDAARRHLTFISESAVQMGRLIDDLLGFSRSGRTELRKEPVNLDALVQEVIRGLHPETQGRRIVWQIAPLPVVNADAALLRVVLTNLFANAVKFTRAREEATIQMGCTQNESEHVFFIRDNGVGFDMRYVEKLFGVFQRLHAVEEFEGTGIGLANVRRIISRHGGRTWAESVLGEGAMFCFSLPKQ